MASVFQRLLGMGGQVAKRGSTELAEELAQEAPEVLGKGTSKLAREASEEIPEAVYKEITPTTGMDDMSLWNRLDKKKAAALLGLGGAGAYMMSGDDDRISTPLVPQPPAKAIEPIKPEELVLDSKKTVRTEEPKKDGLDFDALSKKFDEGMENLPKDEEDIDFRKIIDAGIARRDRADWESDLLRGSENLAAGLARIKPDYGSSDKKSARAKQYTADADQQVGAYTKQSSFDKARAELNDEKAMRDPNSEVSRTVSELAIRTGLIKPGQTVSAMSLKNAGVNLGTLLSVIEAGKARKQEREIARENRQADTQAKIQAKAEEAEKMRSDKRKLITEEVEDRSRNLNDNLDELKRMVNEYGTFEAFGSQNEDMNRLVDTIATDMAKLTDPESVARPSEVALWRNNLIKTGMSGLGMRNATAEDIINNFKNEIGKRRQHAYKVRGISPDNSITPQPDNNSSGGAVKVMAPNGKVKLIPADQVQAAINAGGKLVE